MIKLLVQVGTTLEREFRIDSDKVGIGRAPGNDLVLSDSRVADFHGEIVREGDVLFYRAAGPGQITFINTERVVQPVKLKHDDIINIGKYSIVCYDERQGDRAGEQIVIGGVREATRMEAFPLKR
jgi:pSer/pThr/pTyr-binding forkhead associated (FHA) protein